ncbi:hypothetical protein Dda_8020 [Drechslerella dactyloides]|uniref:Uncharacterized protein n=1 Tax=Drechslerella dactyloides TaxID=74499 RepID=A0AAD6IRC1_DREDA|nr:hypothetical protein Dda_8020 [Drechslerella dactyloides]
MRLSKVNLIRKGVSESVTQNNSTSMFSADRNVVGAFWYIREELGDHQARKIARTKQLDGYRGNIFYGSAEKLWKEREIRKNSPHKLKRPIKSLETQPEIVTGRSYGLPSDDEDDDMNNEVADNLDQATLLQQSYVSSASHHDPLSPPLSPNRSQQTLLDRESYGDDGHTPPMPGSFIFETDAPASPTFSSSLMESIQSVSEFLYSTPTRPSYVNPGLALEHRYDVSSPLPQNSRFDMTPRQLAAFSKRKQGFEKLLERPTTPSAISDADPDEWSLSEKDRMERQRRRKDLQKFRLERQRRLRIESIQGTDEEPKGSRKRPRDDLDPVGVEFQRMETAQKKSRSSEIFAKALNPIYHVLEPQSGTDSSEARLTIAETEVCRAAAGDAIPSVAVSGEIQSQDYGAPTPSPSPPLHPENNFPKQAQPHVPKVPSGLRKATNISSSPAGSPLKISKNRYQGPVKAIGREDETRTRAAVDSIQSALCMTFQFPPLKSSIIANGSTADVFGELSTHFGIAAA